MKTITNVSAITDYAGETPITIYSNPVTMVIRQNIPTPIITRIFYRLCCDCCDCDFDCCCDFCCGCCDF